MHTIGATANCLRAAWNLIPFPVSPKGKAGAGKGSPHAATRSAPANHAGTAHAAPPPARGAFAPLAPSPDQSQPMSPSEDDCAWEKIKGGRHVGLDFYDLLIEVTMLQRATAGSFLNAIWNSPWTRVLGVLYGIPSSFWTVRGETAGFGWRTWACTGIFRGWWYAMRIRSGIR